MSRLETAQETPRDAQDAAGIDCAADVDLDAPKAVLAQMTFLAQTAVAIVNLVAGFYGFWLVWRLLLPILPGPPDADERIAPYAEYFTNPFVVPLARLLHVPQRLVAALSLLVLGALIAALGQLGQAV